MPHYKDANNNVYFLDEDAFKSVLPSSCRMISDDEASTLSNPPPSSDQIASGKVFIVQNYMDDQARALNYDDIRTACTYADEPAVPKFQAEGRAFRAWRSKVWERCYQILDQVNAGERSIPTDEDLINELPELSLPAS